MRKFGIEIIIFFGFDGWFPSIRASRTLANGIDGYGGTLSLILLGIGITLWITEKVVKK